MFNLGTTSDVVRSALSNRIVLFSICSIAFISVVILAGAAWKGDVAAFKELATLLLGSLLPVFGTWVGTVLAFYFGKENFEASQQRTKEMVQSVVSAFATTNVVDAMVPRNRMIVLDIPNGKDLGDIAVGEIRSKFQVAGVNGSPISRLPILDQTGACFGILHRSVWTEMVLSASALGPIINDQTLIKDILAMNYPLRPGITFEQLIRQAVAFVARDKTLAEAKAAMERVLGSQDVIVTETGTSGEPVLGWLSNVEIGKLSSAK